MSNIAKQTNQSFRDKHFNKDFAENFTEKSRLPYFLILFMISPVLGAISAATNFRQQGAKTILVLFFGVFGYTLIMRPGADSYDVMTNFVYHFANLTFTGFFDQALEVLLLQTPRHYGGTNSTIDELFYPSIAFIVSRFTSDPSWFFLFAGLIFGIFYIKGVSVVYDESRQNWNLTIGLLFIFFFSRVFLEGINAPRTHTANWILFSGAFLYLKTADKKYIFLVLMAPFVHFGYIAMIIPFFIYYYFRDMKYVYLTLLLISFFASVGLSSVEPYLMSTELGESKLGAYTEGERWDPELRAERTDTRSFHARYYGLLANYSVFFMLLISLIWSGYMNGRFHDRLQNGLGSIAILLWSFANFASIIPVLSNRLMGSFHLFALAYLVRLYAKNWEELKKRHWIVYICTPFILLYLFTKYSIIGDFMDFRVLFSPLLYPFMGDDPVSIKEFIRQLLGV